MANRIELSDEVMDALKAYHRLVREPDKLYLNEVAEFLIWQGLKAVKK